MGRMCNGEMNLFLVLSLSQYCFHHFLGIIYLFFPVFLTKKKR